MLEFMFLMRMMYLVILNTSFIDAWFLNIWKYTQTENDFYIFQRRLQQDTQISLFEMTCMIAVLKFALRR